MDRFKTKLYERKLRDSYPIKPKNHHQQIQQDSSSSKQQSNKSRNSNQNRAQSKIEKGAKITYQSHTFELDIIEAIANYQARESLDEANQVKSYYQSINF